MSCLTEEVFMYFASVLMVQARISGREWLKTDRLGMLSSLNSGLWFERDFFIVVISETKIIYFKVLINAFRNLMMVWP